MVATAMLMGSTFLDAFTVTVNGNPKVIAAGHYYPRHATAALSLVDALEAAVITEAAGAVWHLTEGLRFRLVPQAAQNVSIAWGSALTARAMAGYTGDMPSQDTPYEATNQSAYWWAPGWLATPETLLGTAGYVTRDKTMQVSADGTAVQTSLYSSQVHQGLEWTDVVAARMRVAAGVDGGGTFHEFHEQSLVQGYRLRYYEEQSEVVASTTAVTWDDTAGNSFGPYVQRRSQPRWYSRVVPNADLYSPLSISLMQVDEYA